MAGRGCDSGDLEADLDDCGNLDDPGNLDSGTTGSRNSGGSGYTVLRKLKKLRNWFGGRNWWQYQRLWSKLDKMLTTVSGTFLEAALEGEASGTPSEAALDSMDRRCRGLPLESMEKSRTLSAQVSGHSSAWPSWNPSAQTHTKGRQRTRHQNLKPVRQKCGLDSGTDRTQT